MTNENRTEKKPTTNEWQLLYKAAEAFKQVKPWKWLFDQDLICVQNPENGETGYCSIMGRGGEHYALGVFLGDSGLAKFLALAADNGEIPQHEIVHYQDCIMGSFDDREFVGKRDMEVIKSLGLKFRGSNEWPVFRRFEPGYFPWEITDEECRFLTCAFEQALFVANVVKAGEVDVDFENGGSILRKKEPKTGQWISEELQLPFLTETYNPLLVNNADLIKELKKARKVEGLQISIDVTYCPTPIGEKNIRPYFSRIFLIAEEKSGQMMKYKMYDDKDEDVDTVMNNLIDFVFNFGIPQKINVRTEKMMNIYGDICKQLGIKLNLKLKLPLIEEFLKGLDDRMR